MAILTAIEALACLGACLCLRCRLRWRFVRLRGPLPFADFALAFAFGLASFVSFAAFAVDGVEGVLVNCVGLGDGRESLRLFGPLPILSLGAVGRPLSFVLLWLLRGCLVVPFNIFCVIVNFTETSQVHR